MPAPNQRDLDFEKVAFDLFAQGKTVNQIAKEYTELAKSYPDHKKRVEKVNNWHKKYKKIIMLGISKTVTSNIEQSIEQDSTSDNLPDPPLPNHSTPPVDETNNYQFQLSVPQIWSQQLKDGAVAKAEHKKWVQDNVSPIEKEFYLYYFKEINNAIKDRILNGKIDDNCKALINLALRIGGELKKNPSFPNYMQESVAYLNMLKSEEGAITAGFIDKKMKVVNVKDTTQEDNAMSLVRLKGLF